MTGGGECDIFHAVTDGEYHCLVIAISDHPVQRPPRSALQPSIRAWAYSARSALVVSEDHTAAAAVVDRCFDLAAGRRTRRGSHDIR